ncbi:hypothetical protein [Fluviispira vulneris]|uniref:hypothetical protein n=1 Tax=Fluviispira vulneris TaxID=2763012 RepID=UPI0016480126|nr:hypothetical protein [Fluviispira vulneris]
MRLFFLLSILLYQFFLNLQANSAPFKAITDNIIYLDVDNYKKNNLFLNSKITLLFPIDLPIINNQSETLRIDYIESNVDEMSIDSDEFLNPCEDIQFHFLSNTNARNVEIGFDNNSNKNLWFIENRLKCEYQISWNNSMDNHAFILNFEKRSSEEFNKINKNIQFGVEYRNLRAIPTKSTLPSISNTKPENNCEIEYNKYPESVSVITSQPAKSSEPLLLKQATATGLIAGTAIGVQATNSHEKSRNSCCSSSSDCGTCDCSGLSVCCQGDSSSCANCSASFCEGVLEGFCAPIKAIGDCIGDSSSCANCSASFCEGVLEGFCAPIKAIGDCIGDSSSCANCSASFCEGVLEGFCAPIKALGDCIGACCEGMGNCGD